MTEVVILAVSAVVLCSWLLSLRRKGSTALRRPQR